MLVPHFHFNGNCSEAIKLYEKAFDTKAYWICNSSDENGNPTDIIDHAEMKIHGQRVMLNDSFGKSAKPEHANVQMVLIFKSEEELLKSYELIKDGIIELDALQKVDYSPLLTCFIDQFGVQWCFMVDENID